MTGRNAALGLAFVGLLLSVLGGAYLPVILRSPLVGAISGGFGVWMIRAMSVDGHVRVVRWLPMAAAYGAAVGLMAALGAWITSGGA